MRGARAGSSLAIAVAACAVAASLVAPAAASSATPTLASSGSGLGCARPRPSETGLARALNQHRRERGLRKLEVDLELSYAARLHAREMANRGELFVMSPEALGSRLAGWTSLAENVGSGGTITAIERAFMASAPDRGNILSPAFSHLGVGVVERDGRLWVALVFAEAADPASTLPSPCLSIAHPPDLPPDAEGAHRDPAFDLEDSGKTVAFRGPQAAGSVRAVAGKPHIPVLLTDFPDNPAEETLHSPAAFQAMLFQQGYPHGAGSMRDYFLDQSGGLLDVTGEVSQWLRMPRSYAEYTGNSFGYQTTGTNDWTLVKDAVNAADPSINFCRGDQDGDGLVDTIFVVHAGPGAEETRSGLWSLRWSLPTAHATDDVCSNGQRAKVKNFTIEPEEYASTRYQAPGAPERLISVGMFVHEFGHELGLPDLYDIDGSSPGGVGPWDPMATGAWGFNGATPWRPTPLSAWSKTELGWAVPTNVDRDSPGTRIPSADRPHSGPFTGVYRLAKDGSASAAEYFLVENHERIGWAADLPQGGLCIWHIDETRRSNDNTDNKQDTGRLVYLVQADGRDDLGYGSEGRGDGGDIFPGTSGKRTINSLTNPSTDYYSGADTLLAVESISDPGATMVADLYITLARPLPVPTQSPLLPTPTPPGSGSGSGSGSTGFSPSGLQVLSGRKVAGSVSSLGQRDGSPLSIKAAAARADYKASYVSVLRLSGDAAAAEVLGIDVGVTSTMTVKIQVQNVTTRKWFTLARTSIASSTPFHTGLGNVRSWVRADGLMKLRFVHRQGARFAHHVDWVRVTPSD